MSHDDDPPELRGYVPSGDRPLRHPATKRVMRVVIVLGIIGLVVPSVAATASVQARTAAAVCGQVLRAGTIDTEPIVRFEVAGPAGPSWYCYTREFGGHEVLVGSLGLIPG